MFALGIEFLTGTAVLTSAASRDEAEWPPHPARIYMALVAAHYETRPLPEDGDDAAKTWASERAALEWLEHQGPPALRCPIVPPERRRTVPKVYVPVNDAGLPSRPESVKLSEMRSALGVMPASRSRQERTFPAVHVGWDAPECFVHFIWPEAELPGELAPAFHRLAEKVIRVGHSSSFVRMWVAEDHTVLPAATLVPHDGGSRRRAAHNLRGLAPGFLSELDRRFNAAEIAAFFALSERILESKGKANATAKTEFEERFCEPWKRSASPPVRLRPAVGVSHAYMNVMPDSAPAAETVFDSALLILTKQEGQILGLEATNMLIELLRGALLTGSEGAPEWFTGHRPAGEPSEQPHLALLSLGYVGAEHADGHIMGLALAFPRGVAEEDRAAQLRRVLFDERGLERDITLTTNSLGNWTLRREDRATPPLALRSETWTGPSTVWASVTPVVLDRHPKNDPSDPTERAAWRDEIAASIVASCRRIGLPAPVAVDVDKTSWHRGAPRSRPGPGGMPSLATKNGGARQQMHVLLNFDVEVRGPVLLGAGRYRGYGLFKPLA